ncbi:MAG TPA: universal stress protein [Burkholderiaceae bacterium]|nr:universal stress protein [Burkholderiaceae bacterium]
MIRRILLGYDGSEISGEAFEFSLDLARKFESELHIIAVARPPEFAEDVEAEAVIETSRQHYDRMLGKLRLKLAPESIKTHLHVVVGHPAEQIVRYAEGHAIDHIVVGHRGHTLFERWLIGSVARQVIAYAHCAVTVVRR